MGSSAAEPAAECHARTAYNPLAFPRPNIRSHGRVSFYTVFYDRCTTLVGCPFDGISDMSSLPNPGSRSTLFACGENIFWGIQSRNGLASHRVGISPIAGKGKLRWRTEILGLVRNESPPLFLSPFWAACRVGDYFGQMNGSGIDSLRGARPPWLSPRGSLRDKFVAKNLGLAAYFNKVSGDSNGLRLPPSAVVSNGDSLFR